MDLGHLRMAQDLARARPKLRVKLEHAHDDVAEVRVDAPAQGRDPARAELVGEVVVRLCLVEGRALRRMVVAGASVYRER